MTCPLIPDFVLKMFEKEITNINLKIVQKICELYNLDEQDVKEKLAKDININFSIVSEDIEQVKIVKKHTKKNDNKDDLCVARVYIPNELFVKQCSRPKCGDDNMFCKLHQRLNQEGKLKYGTIFEDKPDEISTEKLKLKVKKKIY